MTIPAWVISFWAPARARAIPKSATLTWPFGASRTLPGLTSRWTMPLRWAKPKPAATSDATSAARSGCRGPPVRMISARLLPSTYSMTMK